MELEKCSQKEGGVAGCGNNQGLLRKTMPHS